MLSCNIAYELKNSDFEVSELINLELDCNLSLRPIKALSSLFLG